MKNIEPHTIELKEFTDYLFTHSVMYAMSTKENKELRVYLNGAIKIFHEGVKVWEGVQPYKAVEVYNTIK